MCGRFALVESAEIIVETFRCAKSSLSSFKPSFNIAPTQLSPIVRQLEGTREAANLRWGLVPEWAKDLECGKPHDQCSLRNCGREARLPIAAFASRRCIVPASAFLRMGGNATEGKQPYAFTPAGWWSLGVGGIVGAVGEGA